MFRVFIIIFIFLASPSYLFSQELDDMYFTSKDRKVKKTKKVTPADVILSKYRSGFSEINSDSKISDAIINKYKINNSSERNSSISKNRDNLKSLKFNRDELFVSSYFDKKFLDFQILTLFTRVKPNFYSFYDQYYSPFSNNLFSFYDYRWMPRSFNGIRKLAAYDPLMFFSNPYLSSYYPMMSPSLWNVHHPSFSTYGCNVLNSKTYPSWIWTNNGTGGGLQHTLSNYHHYTNGYSNNENVKTVVKGPRSGRGTSLNGEYIGNILPGDRYLGRRESGITNENIQREDNNPIDQTQNAYFRDRSSGRSDYATRSLRSNSIQNSDRRSTNNQNRTFNSRVNALNDTFSNNSLRSNRDNNTSEYYNTNSGRRSSYSQPQNFGSNRSGIFTSSSSNKNSSSGIGSRSNNSNGGNSFSGNSNSFSSGSSSSSSGGSSSAVSGGSSGGSSRGGNN
jgi:hypothetical protein